MKEIKRFLRWLIFPFEYWISKETLKRISNLYTYPLLVYLEFNKELVKTKFINGKSMTAIVLSKAEIIASSMSRHMSRAIIPPSNSVIERYEKYLEKKHNQQEIEEYFEVKF